MSSLLTVFKAYLKIAELFVPTRNYLQVRSHLQVWQLAELDAQPPPAHACRSADQTASRRPHHARCSRTNAYFVLGSVPLRPLPAFVCVTVVVAVFCPAAPAPAPAAAGLLPSRGACAAASRRCGALGWRQKYLKRLEREGLGGSGVCAAYPGTSK